MDIGNWKNWKPVLFKISFESCAIKVFLSNYICHLGMQRRTQQVRKLLKITHCFLFLFVSLPVSSRVRPTAVLENQGAPGLSTS